MSSTGTVLVTGGTGFVATFCIARLLTDGSRVRTTVRDSKRAPDVRTAVERLAPGSAARLDIVECDLSRDDGWRDAASGCDRVLHVASPFPAVAPKHDDEVVRPAREGTLRVLTAARDAGVSRVVLTSSTAANCYGRGGRSVPFTEADWSDPTNLADSSAYERSKTLAERAAWDWLEREGGDLELTAVNPGAILGPVVSADLSTSIVIVRSLLEGAVPVVPRFGWPLVDVRDVADLHVRAMTAPEAAGQRYIGAGPFYWMSDVARVLRTRVPELAKRVPKGTIPSWLLRTIGRFDPLLRDRMYELDAFRPVSAHKAKTELGWEPRSNDEAIVATAESLARDGLVRA
jgi:dihydroflavonol-4-reductase